MKTNKLILTISIIGIFILFFFPSPEENFIAYLGTIVFFAIIIFLLVKFKKK